MSNYKRKEVMDYLTRKPVTAKDYQAAIDINNLRPRAPMPVSSSEERVLNREPFYQQPQQFIQDDIARPQIDNIPLYQGVEPNVAIQETMPTYVPPDMSPVMPQAPQAPDPQYRQIELATGGRVGFSIGTQPEVPEGTDMTNIYWDSRKGIKDPKWIVKVKTKNGYITRNVSDLDEAVKIRNNLRKELQPREVRKLDWEILDKNISSEIEKNNKEFKTSRISELAKKYDIEIMSLYNRINEGKITEPLSNEKLVVNYIEDALKTNKSVKDFALKNIASHINSTLGNDYRNSISEETISKIYQENYPNIYQSIIDKKFSNFLHRNPKLLETPISDYVNPETIKMQTVRQNLDKQKRRVPFKSETYGFNIASKDNTLLNYFDRAYKEFGKEQFVPVKDENNKLIGYQDNSETGKGKTYYAVEYKKNLDPKTEALITDHPDNEKVQTYIQAQNKFKRRYLDERVQKVFTERGYKAPTVDKLLRYFIQKKPSITETNPVVIAHNAQVENKAADISLLDYIKNLEEKDARVELDKIKDPLAKKLALHFYDEDFKSKGIKSNYEGKPLGVTEDIDPYKQIADLDKYVNRKIFQYAVGFKDEEGNIKNIDTMMKDFENEKQLREQNKRLKKSLKLTEKSAAEEPLISDRTLYMMHKYGNEEQKKQIEKYWEIQNEIKNTEEKIKQETEKIVKKSQLGPDIFKSGSGVRTALKMVPGVGQASTAAFIPYDFATALLGGYSLPEATAFAGLNVLPAAVQKAIPALMPGVEQAMGGQEDKVKLANERRQALEQSITNIKNKLTGTVINNDIPSYSEGEVQMKTGGRVHLKNGTEDMYLQEIPSLGLTDPIEILEQQLVNEKDPIKILALDYKLEQMKKRKLQEEAKAAEYKKSQKEKGIRYMEDFPSQTDYFVETGKQLLTNPKYFLGKGAKGLVEGTEWLVGQPLQTLFSQEGKNWEFYHPVAGEKLGINKFIEENVPKGATTGTLFAGDVAEIAGTFIDPFLAYGIVKGATTTSKLKKPVELEEKIDPTRRDLLKTGAVLTGGAIVYPTAKKLGLLETGVKAAKVGNAVRVATHQVVDNMPEFFPYLSEFSLAKGKRIGEDYMRSGMTEFKREITIPLELNTIEKGKTNVKFEFIHNPAEGNVTVYYTNPLTDERHSFDFYQGKQGKQAYGIDPEHPGAWEYYAVEVEPPGFHYKAPNKSDPYRKDYDYYDTATEGDDVIKALDKWYKELPKAEKEKFEKKFITHSEYTDEIPAASYNSDENYPIIEFMYPKEKK